MTTIKVDNNSIQDNEIIQIRQEIVLGEHCVSMVLNVGYPPYI